MNLRRAGFTLVELMIVIAIIGILAGALVFQVTKAGDSARSMRCRVNLKNLAQAAINYGVENEYMAAAGCFEHPWPEDHGNGWKTYYHENAGWVSWTGRSPGSKPTPTRGQSAKFFGSSWNRSDVAYVSVTNGALWYLSGKDFKNYVCETHKKVCQRNNARYVMRSYVMNAYFGYDCRSGDAVCPPWRRIPLQDVSNRGNAASLLLFAELPVFAPGSKPRADKVQNGYNGGMPCWADGVLETPIMKSQTDFSSSYNNSANKEYIGFNHLTANRYTAHVAFADGHVEALVEPRKASESDLQKLTQQLCSGYEIDDDILVRMK